MYTAPSGPVTAATGRPHREPSVCLKPADECLLVTEMPVLPRKERHLRRLRRLAIPRSVHADQRPVGVRRAQFTRGEAHAQRGGVPAETLFYRGQGRAIQLGTVGVGLDIANQREVGGTAVGIAVGPTQFASRRQPRHRLGRMVVDVLLVDLPGRGVGHVVPVVDRRPHRPVRGDRQSGAVAHSRRERLRGPTVGGHSHDRRPRRRGVAVLGGDVARRADREVHGAI